MDTQIQFGGEDLRADRRRPGELELLAEAKQCFHDGWDRHKAAVAEGREGGAAAHCTFDTVPGRWYWHVQFPGDAMLFGGMALPMDSTLTPCDEHLPRFEHTFRVIRLCPCGSGNELAPRHRKCDDCVGGRR